VRVTIPSLTARCPAASALHMEGVDHDVVLIQDDLHYGRVMASLWERGSEFITIEHDVVPWPGAIAQLWGCPQLWCQHLSLTGPGKIRRGMGSLRVSTEAIRLTADSPPTWAQTHWSQLENRVISALNSRLGDPHLHTPPFAHAKGST